MPPETRADAPGPGASAAQPAPPAARAVPWHSIPLAGAIAICGLTTAGLSPTLSLFLADAVHAAPFLVGLFFTARAAAGVAANLATGWISDRMRDRRVLIALTGVTSAASTLCLALFRDYTVVLVTCVIFASVGQGSLGQLFAYAKELSAARERDATSFTAVMRSVFSAAYAVGPPLALFMLARYGFRPLYMCVACLYLASVPIGRWGLRRAVPVAQPASQQRGGQQRGGAWRAIRRDSSLSARLWLLLGVVLVLGIVNQMYGIDIALHVTRDLRQSPQLVGWMLGVTAGLEIPVMIAAGRVASRVGRGRLVGVSAVVAAVSYCLLPLAASPAALLALAALIGLWQGVTLSIPMVMVQDEAPGGAGITTSLYNAAFGAAGMLAGAVTGVTASAVGYGNVLWVCAGLSAVAVFLMLARFALGRGGLSSAAGRP